MAMPVVRVEPCECHPPPTAGAILLGVALLIVGALGVRTLIHTSVIEHVTDDGTTDDWSQRGFLMVEKTLSALDRAIQHLLLIGGEINLDSVFTVRLMEAQLSAFQNNLLQDNSLAKSNAFGHILERIKKIREKAQELQRQYSQSVQKKKTSYFDSKHFVLSSGSWDLWYSMRDIDRNTLPTYGFEQTVKEHLSEDQVDLCLKETYSKQCNFSEECWNLMTYSFYNGYSLTHEIFFILNAFAFGCENETETLSQKSKHMSVDTLVANECAAVLHESEMFASKNFPLYHRDLFLEQATFCGILGYRDFFREEWLNEILSWQSEKGCYQKNTTALQDEYNKDFPSVFNEQIRNKRKDLIMTDGCSVHMTGVALTALGQYVRFLLEPLLLQ